VITAGERSNACSRTRRSSIPERLDRVIVSTSHASIEISWDARQRLLDQLRRLDSARDLVAKFEGVGASRPVDLTQDEEALLVDVIDAWTRDLGGTAAPAGILELRRALLLDFVDRSGDS